MEFGALSQATGGLRHQPRVAVTVGIFALKLVFIVGVGELILASVVGQSVASNWSFGAVKHVIEDEAFVTRNLAWSGRRATR